MVCFLETLTDAQKKKRVKIKGVRTFKFGNGNKLNSLYKVILPCVIADIEVSIITDVVNSDIPLLLSKDAMKRAGTCLNFEDDTVTMLKKKIPLSCTSSGHYYIPITKLLPEKRKFKYIPFIKEISSKNMAEKIQIATKLHRQFSHPSSKKLYNLVKNAGVTDPEFIKILQILPNSCELCIRYKKIEPKPIVGNFNMASVTSGSKSGISKKSLYKPGPKERIKAKRTNRKPLAQSQLVDLNNPRSAKICKNGMKSLLTLEHNFLSPDVQRRETICTPGKASISCRQYDAEVDDKLSETMNEKENQNKEDYMHIQFEREHLCFTHTHIHTYEHLLYNYCHCRDCRGTCCLVNIFGPPLFMLIYLEKAKEANDVWRRGQKIHLKQSGTNKFKFINNNSNLSTIHVMKHSKILLEF